MHGNVPFLFSLAFTLQGNVAGSLLPTDNALKPPGPRRFLKKRTPGPLRKPRVGTRAPCRGGERDSSAVTEAPSRREGRYSGFNFSSSCARAAMAQLKM